MLTDSTPLSDPAVLAECLTNARLPHVARALREERASLNIPSHMLYTQQTLLRAGSPRMPKAPLYPTPPNSHGARRCTIAGSLEARPLSAPAGSPPATSNALYSSPYLLRQFAEPDKPSLRPATAAAAANARAWRSALDTHANSQSYAFHRASGRGWPLAGRGSPGGRIDILDVQAEQERGVQASRVEATETSVDDATRPPLPPPPLQAMPPPPPLPTSPQATAHREGVEEGVEETTPPVARTAVGSKVASMEGGLGRTSRRTLEMSDAARFYASASSQAQRRACPASPGERLAVPQPPPVVQVSLARARALQANRSDIFFARS